MKDKFVHPNVPIPLNVEGLPVSWLNKQKLNLTVTPPVLIIICQTEKQYTLHFLPVELHALYSQRNRVL